MPAWSTSEASRTRGRPAPTNRLSPKNRSSGRAPEPQADSSAGAMEPGDAGRRVTASPVPPPFVRVAPSLFLGSARAAGAEEQLARAGVTLCVNVSRQQPGPGAPGVAELRVPVFDDPAEDLLAHLEPTCAAMEAAVRGGGACLVYCKNGRSRSAAVCTAYLMRHRGLSLAQAFQVGGPLGDRCFERGVSSGDGFSGRGGLRDWERYFREGRVSRKGGLREAERHFRVGRGLWPFLAIRATWGYSMHFLFADGEERSPGSGTQPGLLVSAPEV